MTDARHAEFARMYRRGVAMAGIAKAMRISKKTARRWRDMIGLPKRPRTTSIGARLDDAALKFIRQHYGTKEWSASAIGKRFGVSKNVIIGRASRMGLRKKERPQKRKEPPTHRWGMPIAPPKSRCQWIDGDVTPAGNFHYCGEQAIAGHSYCTNHAKRAFTPAAFERIAPSMQ